MKMKRTTIACACLAVASALIPGSAFAQSGFSSAKEISTAEAADKLLQPAGSTTPTGLTTSLATDGVPVEQTLATQTAPANVIAVESVPAAPAAPDPLILKLFNCSGAGIKVKTFNSNDTMLWVAYQEKSIANGAAADLKCATSTCKLKVNSGAATAAMTGPQVYIGGAVKPLAKAAITNGCSVPAPPPA